MKKDIVCQWNKDISAISHLAETSSANVVIGNTVILVFLVACWIFSIIDAYQKGKRSFSDAGDLLSDRKWNGS